MSLITEAERILIEEARKVARIAGKSPDEIERGFRRLGQAGGAIGGGVVGGGAGAGIGAGIGGWVADEVHDLLFGNSGDEKRSDMRKQARHAIGRLSEQLGREIAAFIRRQGLGTLFDRIAQGAPLAQFSEYLGEDLTPLRGVPRGAGQTAATLYMDAAAPRSRTSPPARLYRSQEWAILVGAWSGFGDLAARITAVMAALDAGGLPDPAAGARALKSAYAAEWGAVEREVGRPLFGAGSGQARQETGRTAPVVVQVPGWRSAKLPNGLQGTNPATGKPWMTREAWNAMSKAQRIAWLQQRGLPVEYAEPDGAQRYANKNNGAGGGTGPLIVGGLAVTGLGVAAAFKRRGPRRGRRQGGKGRRK